jgi:hypothetical protein
VYFEIVGPLTEIEVIAKGHGIRDVARLRKKYGAGRWRKLKGRAHVRLDNGHIRLAEIHWYEAHGLGKKRLKIKRFLD